MSKTSFPLFDRVPYLQTRLMIPHEINQSIYDCFLTISNDDFKQMSHYFHGRYENLYVDEQKVPGLNLVLNHIKEFVADLLQLEAEQLKFGYWLNAMNPGHLTTRHNHDDDDELISGVYYLHAAKDSGDLRLFTENKVIEISPQEGNMVLFSPQLDHEVSLNESEVSRLSIGFNVG